MTSPMLRGEALFEPTSRGFSPYMRKSNISMSLPNLMAVGKEANHTPQYIPVYVGYVCRTCNLRILCSRVRNSSSTRGGCRPYVRVRIKDNCVTYFDVIAVSKILYCRASIGGVAHGLVLPSFH